jgi:hypothetical protein
MPTEIGQRNQRSFGHVDHSLLWWAESIVLVAETKYRTRGRGNTYVHRQQHTCDTRTIVPTSHNNGITRTASLATQMQLFRGESVATKLLYYYFYSTHGGSNYLRSLILPLLHDFESSGFEVCGVRVFDL